MSKRPQTVMELMQESLREEQRGQQMEILGAEQAVNDPQVSRAARTVATKKYVQASHLLTRALRRAMGRRGPEDFSE